MKRAFFALALILLPWQASAAVTFRAATAVTVSTSNPATHAVTVDSTDHVLIVPLLISGGTSRTGGTPTIGGQNLTQAGTEQKAASAPETVVELWYIVAPPTGSQTISVPNAGGLGVRTLAIGGTSSTGVAIFDSADGGNGTSLSPADTITTNANGALIIGVVGSGANTWTDVSGHTGTAIFDTDLGTFGWGVQYIEQGSAGAQSVGWTFGSVSEDWGICSVAIVVGAASTTQVSGPLLGVGP